MALGQRELKTDAAADSLLSPNPRISSDYDINVTFGPTASDTALAVGYPVGYNSTTGKHGLWTAPDPTILTVTLTGATAGTWGVTVNGQTIANTVIAYNATAATVVAELKAIGYDVSVDLTSSVYTITFDADAEVSVLPTVTGDVTQITGGTPTAVATAGTATGGTHDIVGFVNPEDDSTDDTDDEMIMIMVKGIIHYDLPASLVAAGDVTALQTALKDGLVAKGLIVQGLAGRY